MAQFTSKEAIANTPHSSQFNNSILNTEEKVNNNSKNSSDTIKFSKKSRTSTDGQVKKKLATQEIKFIQKLKLNKLLTQ